MSHQATRRAPVVAPTSLECPLASLGRNSNAVLDSLTGHHPPPYHHPLSSSPLDPQIYQMSRKSPDLSIDTDDIIYTSSVSQQGDTVDGLINEITNMEEDAAAAAAAAQRNHVLPEMYQLSRSSSHSSLEQALPVPHKAATFELRGRHGFSANNGICAAMSSASVGRSAHQQRSTQAQHKNFLALEHLLQYGRHERTPSAYLLPGNNADTEDSSDAAVGDVRIRRHQGGRCSVPTVSSNCARNNQYYLENKMDALYLRSGMRGLPLGSEANHFQNERYYLEDGLRNMCDYSGNDRITEGHLIHHRASSPSETSGSDRYLLNRTSSPSNAFSSSNHLDHFSNSNNTTSSSNLALDQRFHHGKVKSLSDGLCNLGRFSPSLDQGYATLVSPSPTGHHPNTITTHSIVHHQPNVALTAATARRHLEAGPPPWGKKGPYRSGPLFDRLPDEAIIKIFSWFDSCELCKVARACRRFEQLAWKPILWKVISLKGEHLNGDKTLKMIFRKLCGQSRNGSCMEVERVLLADGCRISDKGLQLLTRRCPELTHLQLQMCGCISNQAMIDVLTKCTNLQHLDVTGCSQVNSISPNPNLEPTRRLLLQYLDLTDCIAIDDVGLKIVVKNCPQLIYLYLRRCIQITDAGLKYVPSFCIALKELSVSDCVNITDFGLYELAKLGAALRYLSVAKCDRVSDAGLKVIARRCYKLRYLNARGCEAVSDDSITVLARSCPRLRALDIGKCDVSDAGLRALAESCPNLKKLSLRNCDMITDRGVQCIAYYCRGLQQLNIQDCQISIEGYRAVKKYCKRCIIEHTNPGFC
ncbi:F-box/LRR-repeat protein 7 [Teleopsis dalmanni]|uniref:F-box/LRR-repeat protein 7 n=1 Tax=Teleopsis dalmanni TaxID=139649 RepID=UPI0018CD19CF|nr:F-box/LRR-repeat protein 7 [Teleopsis dalmanni]